MKADAFEQSGDRRWLLPALGGAAVGAIVAAGAVTVLGDRIVDDRPLRFANEFVRHQAQCMIGDLYLAGGPIIGLATARGASRGMTIRLLEKLFGDAGAWSWSDLSRGERPGSAEPFEPVPQTAAVGA